MDRSHRDLCGRSGSDGRRAVFAEVIRMRWFVSFLVACCVLGASVPAYAVGEDLTFPPKDWKASRSLWDMYSDAQKLEILRTYNYQTAVTSEYWQTVARDHWGPAGEPISSARTPIRDAAVSSTWSQATIGQVSEATGYSTKTVSQAVVNQSARAQVSGMKSWAKRNGVKLGEAILPTLLVNGYLGYIDAHPAVYVHADGSECHSWGVLCGESEHFISPELESLMGEPSPFGMGFEGVLTLGEGESYVFTPLEGARPEQPVDSGRSIVGYAIDDSYNLWPAEAESLLDAAIEAQSADMPIMPTWGFEAAPADHFKWTGLKNTVTGSIKSLQGVWFFPSPMYSYTVPTLRNDTKVSAWQDAASWYSNEMDVMLAAGTVTVVDESTTETMTVGAIGPTIWPGSPYVARTTTPYDAENGFDPNMTVDEAAESVSVPETVPQPVHDATETTPEDQTQATPFEVPPAVSSVIETIWRPIIAPLSSVFEGIDWFWPFHFMAERG